MRRKYAHDSYRAVWAPGTTSPSALASILRKAAPGYARCTLERFAKHFRLTNKECEYLARVANGISPKQIAGEFGCSIQAVYAHLARLSTKTGCANYQEVIAKLFQFSCHGSGQLPLLHPSDSGGMGTSGSGRSVVWLGYGWRDVMENSVNLKKRGVFARMAQHPLGALMGGLASAAVCGILGSAHGDIVAAVMAGLGAIVGAPLGAMLGASSHREP